LEGITTSAVSFQACGGGVMVSGGTVVMQNAVVEENTAELVGGGIYVYYGLVQLMAGQVTKNYAASCGGGVGMSPIASVLAGLDPRVIGNTSGENKTDNVCLEASTGSDGSDPTRPLFIGADMGENACIGMTRLVLPDETKPSRVVVSHNSSHTITEQDLKAFCSDDPKYTLLLEGGDIVLTVADVVFDTKGHGETPPGQHIDDTHKVQTPTEPTADGYTFGGWYQDEDCTDGQEWDFNTDEITELDQAKPLLTLYAKWTATPFKINYTLEEGGTNAAANPDTYTIESDTITLQAPTREGYTFLGWTEAGTDDAPRKDVTIPQGSTGERTFIAQWEKNEPPASGGGSYTPSVKPSEPSSGYAACPRDTTCPIWPYPDADTKAWYHDGVHYCIENGLMQGYLSGLFGPNDCLTRAQLAQILYNRAGAPAVTGGSPFDDVDGTAWFAEAVAWAAEQGVVEGYGGGRFGPDDPVTREQLAAMLYRYQQKYGDGGFTGNWMLLLDFADRDAVSEWAYESVCWATMKHVVEGKDNKVLDPQGNATRAEAAAMIQRFFTL